METGMFTANVNGVMHVPEEGGFERGAPGDLGANDLRERADAEDGCGVHVGGHEPGNVDLFRIANERGLLDPFNPHEVAVSKWEDGKATRQRLTNFERTPLPTSYLQKDGEPK
jgi:hypothetical protein